MLINRVVPMAFCAIAFCSAAHAQLDPETDALAALNGVAGRTPAEKSSSSTGRCGLQSARAPVPRCHLFFDFFTSVGTSCTNTEAENSPLPLVTLLQRLIS